MPIVDYSLLITGIAYGSEKPYAAIEETRVIVISIMRTFDESSSSLNFKALSESLRPQI